MKSVRIHVTGRVQGVFFRVYTREFAKGLAVSGYVRNLPDGRVEIVAEGSEDSLKKIVSWAKNKGSPASRIHNTKEHWDNIEKPRFFDFQIRY